MGVDRHWEHQAELQQCPAKLAAAEARIGELERDLKRAHAALTVLYVGTRARRPDGSVDVGAVIDACVGEEA